MPEIGWRKWAEYWLAIDGRSQRTGAPPIGGGSTPRFALIADSDVGGSVANRFAGVTELRVAPGGMDELWVVRPDGYVGLVARRDDAAAAEAYLAGIVT